MFLKVFKKTEGWKRFFDYQNESHVAANFGGHGRDGTLKTCQDELGRLLFGRDFCVTSYFRDTITGTCNGNQLVEELYERRLIVEKVRTKINHRVKKCTSRKIHFDRSLPAVGAIVNLF